MTGGYENRSGQRGFALLVVLMAAGLLALIGTRLTGAGRTEVQIARNLASAAIAEAAAEGAVAEAAFHLLAPPPQTWMPDGAIQRIVIGTATIDIRIDSEAGKLNPNTAPLALMAALLRRVGVPAAAAETLAAAVQDWRTPGDRSALGGSKAAIYPVGAPGRLFESLDELGNVPGVTMPVLDALRSVLSVYNDGGLDARYAAPALKAALQDVQLGFDAPDGAGAPVTVTAVAGLSGGARAVRRAVLQLRPSPRGRPYRVLTWESPYL
jgi:general secretion pathway protein K